MRTVAAPSPSMNAANDIYFVKSWISNYRGTLAHQTDSRSSRPFHSQQNKQTHAHSVQSVFSLPVCWLSDAQLIIPIERPLRVIGARQYWLYRRDDYFYVYLPSALSQRTFKVYLGTCVCMFVRVRQLTWMLTRNSSSLSLTWLHARALLKVYTQTLAEGACDLFANYANKFA
jgi:hypothetical protein